jgi:mono/diheme cytochrome c family protein
VHRRLVIALSGVALAVLPAVAALAQLTPSAGLERAQTLYQASCASCHGDHGQGAAMPGLGLPRLDSGGTTWQQSDAALALLIRNGSGLMAGVGTAWSDEDVNAVLNLIRSWWTPEQQRRHDALSPRSP